MPVRRLHVALFVVGIAAFCALTLTGLLGYVLFRVLPQGYLAAGFGMVESLLLVTAAINIHHFVVDAFIWRLAKGGGNRRIVDGDLSAAV